MFKFDLQNATKKEFMILRQTFYAYAIERNKNVILENMLLIRFNKYFACFHLPFFCVYNTKVASNVLRCTKKLIFRQIVFEKNVARDGCD